MTGILFDLDGTLLDTLEDLADGVNHALSVFGYPQRSLDEIRRFVGNGAWRLIELSVPAGEDPEPVFREFQTFYRAHCRIKTGPYAGIPEALEQLGKNCSVGIVSNKPDMAVKPLCADFFPGVYALGETPEIPRKPAPDMLFRAMAELNIDRCLYVGDSEVDIRTAENAGLPCISVCWGFRDAEALKAAGARCLCRDAAEMVEKIEEWIHGK